MNVFYSLLSPEDDGKFVEITEWTNGEGWDIALTDKIISLSRDEFEAISILIKLLDLGMGLTKEDA